MGVIGRVTSLALGIILSRPLLIFLQVDRLLRLTTEWVSLKFDFQGDPLCFILTVILFVLCEKIFTDSIRLPTWSYPCGILLQSAHI